MKLKRRILVVEDDDAIRDALIAILEIEGHEIVTAENGKDAFDKLAQLDYEPDVILLDLNMPRLSGREFLRIRDERKICPNSRIAVFAATKDIESLPGVTTWIRKPADLETILSVVEQS